MKMCLYGTYTGTVVTVVSPLLPPLQPRGPTEWRPRPRQTPSAPKVGGSWGSWRCQRSCWSPWPPSCPGWWWEWSCLTLWSTKRSLVGHNFKKKNIMHLMRTENWDDLFSVIIRRRIMCCYFFRHSANHVRPRSSCQRRRGWSVQSA